MSCVPLGPEDAPALETFLADHPESSMFFRANLADHGLGGAAHRNAMTVWAARSLGRITAALAATRGGFLLCQAPGAGREALAGLVEAARGHRMIGMTGPVDQVDAVLACLGLAPCDFRRHSVEPLFRRALDRMPSRAGLLRRPGRGDRGRLARWFLRYEVETGLVDPVMCERDRARARARAATWPDSRVRLYDEGGRTVAMGSINACVGGYAQVGGVFVPPRERGRGLGGTVALACLEAIRSEGVGTGVLFAASPIAARAYAAAGFERCGATRVAILHRPLVIGERPCA